jgi:hypothetical protein
MIVALTLTVVVVLSNWALAQPLDPTQHKALMIVYNDIGNSLHWMGHDSHSDAPPLVAQDAMQRCAHDSKRRQHVLARCCVVRVVKSHVCTFVPSVLSACC